MNEVTIYTDGACSGNPGKGGWGAILINAKETKYRMVEKKFRPSAIKIICYRS